MLRPVPRSRAAPIQSQPTLRKRTLSTNSLKAFETKLIWSHQSTEDKTRLKEIGISIAIVTKVGTEVVRLKRNIIEKTSKEETPNGDLTGMTTEVIRDRRGGKAPHHNERSTSHDRQNGFETRSVLFEEDSGRTSNNQSLYRHNQSLRNNTRRLEEIPSRWITTQTKHLQDTNPKIKNVDIVNEETTLLTSVKPVLIAFALDISEKIVLCKYPTRKTKTVYSKGSSRRLEH